MLVGFFETHGGFFLFKYFLTLRNRLNEEGFTLRKEETNTKPKPALTHKKGKRDQSALKRKKKIGWVLCHIHHCRLFNAKSSFYIYIKYIWFGWVGFDGISTIVGYLMPNPLYTYIWFGWVGFYGISTIVGYLMPNHLSTYILNIYDLVWLGLMAYQPLKVI